MDIQPKVMNRNSSHSINHLLDHTEAGKQKTNDTILDRIPFGGQRVPEAFIRAMLLLKSVAARTNLEMGYLSSEKVEAIYRSCEQLRNNSDLTQAFDVDVYQINSTNKVNKLINELVSEQALAHVDDKLIPSELNLGQNNDSMSSAAIFLSLATELEEELMTLMKELLGDLQQSMDVLDDQFRYSNQRRQDFQQSQSHNLFQSWIDELEENVVGVLQLLPQLQYLTQQEAKVDGDNRAPDKYAMNFNQLLKEETGYTFDNKIEFGDEICPQTVLTDLSTRLKKIGVLFLRISSDLQPESDNKPGEGNQAEARLELAVSGYRIDPVILKVMMQLSSQVIGNDLAFNLGVQSSHFNPEIAIPLVENNLLNNIQLLSNICWLVTDHGLLGVNNSCQTNTLDRKAYGLIEQTKVETESALSH